VKKSLALLVLCLPIAAQACFCKPAKPLKDTLDPAALPKNLWLVIEVADYGPMALKLYTEDAPYNVANVANLAIKGFYDNLIFHRIIPGFVVQGGDPEGTGSGGTNNMIRAEIKRKHIRGAIAMARTGDAINPKREADCQFYICLAPLAQLDGQYTVIGEMEWGFDVLDRIGAVPTGAGDRPINPVQMKRVWVTTVKPKKPRG
jgi:peptidyl-prolyl cis-trans isomerase B (cyclophilin B)